MTEQEKLDNNNGKAIIVDKNTDKFGLGLMIKELYDNYFDDEAY